LIDEKQLQAHLNAKLAEIAKKIPHYINESRSFKCGHAMGYKQALLDIDRLLFSNNNSDSL